MMCPFTAFAHVLLGGLLLLSCGNSEYILGISLLSICFVDIFLNTFLPFYGLPIHILNVFNIDKNTLVCCLLKAL